MNAENQAALESGGHVDVDVDAHVHAHEGTPVVVPDGGSRTRAGLLQLRSPITFSMRAASHAVLGIRFAARRRSPRWLVAAGVAVGIDAVLAHRLRDPAYRPGWPQRLAEWADTAVWSIGTETTDDVVALVAAAAIPATVVATIDAMTGTVAVPVPPGAEAWPPSGPPDAVRRAVAVASAAVVPQAIIAGVRRARGRSSAAPAQVVVLAYSGLAALAVRQRERLQIGERTRWWARAASQVAQASAAARAELAVGHSPGHDFKKTLLVIGAHGSDAAALAAREQAAHPTGVVSSLAGTTLFDVARPARVDPEERAVLWLSPPEMAAVRAFLRRAEDDARDGADPAVVVHDSTPDLLVLEHLGSRLRIRRDPPPLRARLAPTTPVLVVGAANLLGLGLVGEVPWTVLVPSIGALVVAAGRYWNRPPQADELPWLLGTTLAVSGFGFVATARHGAPGTTAHSALPLPMSAFASVSLLILGAHWGRLTAPQRALVPAVFAGWAVAAHARHGARLALPDALAGALNLVQVLGALWRLSDLADDEAAQLEDLLHAELDGRRREARDAVRRHELVRWWRQLAIARAALDGPEVRASMGDELVRAVHAECDLLERWLIEQSDERPTD